MNNVIQYKVHEIDATLDFCRLRENVSVPYYNNEYSVEG